jgi:hypothetical protein
MTDVWGPPVWKFLHTLVDKVKPESFTFLKDDLIHFIKSICDQLPCPECSTHATMFMRKVNYKNIHDKETLRYVLFKFHNEVNKRLKYDIQDERILEQYQKSSIEQCYVEFVKNITAFTNQKQMIHSMHRNRTIQNLTRWLRKNKNHFILS